MTPLPGPLLPASSKAELLLLFAALTLRSRSSTAVRARAASAETETETAMAAMEPGLSACEGGDDKGGAV